jgi:uncharacterized protein
MTMLAAGVERIDENVVGPMRARELAGKYLVTNVFGDWLWLKPEELKAFAEGSLDESGETYQQLLEGRFIHGELNIDEAASRFRSRHRFLDYGPGHHVVALNGSGRDEDGDIITGAMSLEDADRVVDCAFMSTNPRLDMVLAGDDPLTNQPVLERIVDYVESKNRLARKEVYLYLDSDLRSLDATRVAWLVEHNVQIIARMDDAIQDADHPAHKWIPKIHEALTANGADVQATGVEIRAHLTGETDQAARVIQTAVDAGVSRLDLSPGVPLVIDGEPALDADLWLSAYGEAMCKILGLNADGASLVERFSADLLASILNGARPSRSAMRSPAKDGIGQLAYGWDGRVFASETGRRIGETGDDLFELGQLRYNGYHDMMTHSTVRSLIVAGMLSAQPGWSDCAYEPFCGVSPSDRYAERGSIQGGLMEGSLDRALIGAFDILFRTLHDANDATRTTFDTWAGVGN